MDEIRKLIIVLVQLEEVAENLKRQGQAESKLAQHIRGAHKALFEAIKEHPGQYYIVQKSDYKDPFS